MKNTHTYSAFENNQLICQGPLNEVILKIKKSIGKEEHTSALIFSDESGRTLDFNFRGTEKEVLKRLEIYLPENQKEEVSSGPGRPKLGVVSREVSLLPRHWEWLATQKGGASVTLRNLVEEARKKSTHVDDGKQSQESTYQFMTVMAGDLENYEEALRALFKKDKKTFLKNIQGWPKDIKDYITKKSKPVFTN